MALVPTDVQDPSLQAPHMYTFGPVTASLGNSEEKEATEARDWWKMRLRVLMQWGGEGTLPGTAGSLRHVLLWGVPSLQPPIPGSLWTLDQARLSLPSRVLSPQASPGCVTSV